MDIKTQRRMVAILQILHDAPTSLGSEKIAKSLEMAGIDLSERAVRNYLAQTDTLGWTENLGRRGRQLTPQGISELEGALVVDKVGFIAAKVDTLSYQMDFDLASRKGKIILNLSTISIRDLRPAIEILQSVYKVRLGMGRLAVLGMPGETIGSFRVPDQCAAIGTVCSVSMNGILLHANISTHSRFGGLLEHTEGRPQRFTQIITYDGSSLDPLEIFIRGHMTSVGQTARTGHGMIGASFREVPAVALPEVLRLVREVEEAGLGGVLAVGSPNQPLLDIPVSSGRVGFVLAGGLNPIAAIVEAGIPVTSTAMSSLCDYNLLSDYRTLSAQAARR